MYEENDRVIYLVKEKYRQDFSIYDGSYINNIILGRMNSTHCATIGDYGKKLSKETHEFEELQNKIKNSYSEFFRDPLTFDYLEQIIFPGFLENKTSGKEQEIRIWSAACAMGQEAYSLAILCDEVTKTRNCSRKFRIFATDIRPDVIDAARDGLFQSASLNKVTLRRVQTYFSSHAGVYSISPELKNKVDFSVFDLLSERECCPPASIYGNFDLIFCSNLLFYYETEIQKSILEKMKQCLNPGGYLVTGESEREIVRSNGFSEVFRHAGIFKRR